MGSFIRTTIVLSEVFDASQYEFFGTNVMEHNLGEFNKGMDYTNSYETTEEDLVVPGDVKGKDVMSSSCIDDLATGFTQMNKIGEPRSSRNIPERDPYPTPGFKRHLKPVPHGRWIGTVKWYNNQRGYGFLTTMDGENDVFVHYSSLKTDGCIHVSPGTYVEFEVVSGLDRKLQAINVTAPGGRLLKDSRRLEDGGGEVTASSGRIGGSEYSEVVGPCFRCGKLGHLAKNCSEVADAGVGYSHGWCYRCGKMGHMACYCPLERLYK